MLSAKARSQGKDYPICAMWGIPNVFFRKRMVEAKSRRRKCGCDGTSRRIVRVVLVPTWVKKAETRYGDGFGGMRTPSRHVAAGARPHRSRAVDSSALLAVALANSRSAFSQSSVSWPD